jgi:hypothetical protein
LSLFLETKDVEEWENYYEEVDEDSLTSSKVIRKPVITKDESKSDISAGGKRKKSAAGAGKVQQKGIGSFFSKKQ